MGGGAYTPRERRWLHECSPYFLTRPLHEQTATVQSGMTELAWAALQNELNRDKDLRLRRGNKR